MIYTFIVERCTDLPVEQCCRAMRVSRSAFYAWRHRQTEPTAKPLMASADVKAPPAAAVPAPKKDEAPVVAEPTVLSEDQKTRDAVLVADARNAGAFVEDFSGLAGILPSYLGVTSHFFSDSIGAS